MNTLHRHLTCSLRAVGLVLGMSPILMAWPLPQHTPRTTGWMGSERADPERLSRHVHVLADPLHPRNPAVPDQIQRVESYIRGIFAHHTPRCSEQPYTAGRQTARNLIAHFGPQKGPRLIVGAHYDAYGGLPGADDNASGVAALLELARLLAHADLKIPVDLVAYSTEEPPFFATQEMGSWIHANRLRQTGTQVRAMICVEMIGYFAKARPEPDPRLRTLFPPDADFIAIVGRESDRALVQSIERCFRDASPLETLGHAGPSSPGTDLSDHRNYWAMGIPAVMITDTAFLRNPNYHKTSDTADTLDYPKMAQVVDGLYNAVLHLAR